MKCRQCTDYKAHDREFGYCFRYREQRRWNDKCIIHEPWFKEGDNNAE